MQPNILMLSKSSLYIVLISMKLKPSSFFENNITDWLAAYCLVYNNKMLVDIMLCAERIGWTSRFMVPKGDSRITKYINQRQCTNHL